MLWLGVWTVSTDLSMIVIGIFFLNSTGSNPMCEMFRTGTQGGADRTDHQKWVIGDPAFVREALGADQARRIRLARYAAEGQTIDSVCTKVAEYYRIQPYELRHRRARGECSKARKALAWICHKELDMPISGIAFWLNVGSTAVSMMMPVGEEYAREFPTA